MKKRLILLAAVLLFTFQAGSVFATERNFPAGSYIIPMDSTYQSDNDGGIFEAYGLVYQLLDAGAVVHWIVDETKTSISAADMVISDSTTDPVVSVYDHAGGTSPLAGITTSVSYAGAPFVISASNSITVAEIEAVIDNSSWSAVDVHKSNAPFAANVSREMTGTPPKIALLNNGEDLTTGNVSILEAYLRLGGIDSSIYTIISPFQVRDGILDPNDGPTNFPGVADAGNFTLLWAPHWAAFEKAPYTNVYSGSLTSQITNYCENTGSSTSYVEADAVIYRLSEFLDSGNGLFAECASIQAFEHSRCGGYLSTNDIAHDGGTQDSTKMVYKEKGVPFAQVGDYTYAPEGGHLHNWRPWSSGDLYDTKSPYMLAPDAQAPVDATASAYRATVKRFVHDDANSLNIDPNTDGDQWDYYIGGRKDGDNNKGYVVYLGGHKYASCSGSGGSGGSSQSGGSGSESSFEFEFEWKDTQVNGETVTITVKYTDPADSLEKTLTLNAFTFGNTGSLTKIDDGKIEMDLTGANFKDDKKLQGVYLTNLDSNDITFTSISLSWSGGNSVKIKKIKDKTNGVDYYSSGGDGTDLTVAELSANNKNSSYESDACNNNSACNTLATGAAVSSGSGSTTSGGQTNYTDNNDCTWTNVAGVRYVLNTLFNLQFTVVDVEYIRSTPVLAVIDSTSILFQGSFKYPSYKGRFKAFDLSDLTNELWEFSANMPTATARTIVTNVDGVQYDFDTTNIGALRAPLNLTPNNGDDTDENDLIDSWRGKELGAIEHSSAALIGPSSRVNSSRPYTAFVGDLYGKIYALDVSNIPTSKSASLLWSFIPESQLGAIKNDRTDDASSSPYPGVDGTMTVADVYIRTSDTDFSLREWKTYLLSINGNYGEYSSLYALDVSDPTATGSLFKWEGRGTSDDLPPATDLSNVVMGNGSRVVISMVKNADGEMQYIAAVATSYKGIVDNHGGIRAFAFDLFSGDQLWSWNADYVDSVNDIPGSITSIDRDFDGYDDTLVIGDMDGRLWELDSITGESNNKDSANVDVPLFTGGTGADVENAGVGYPITASVSVGRDANWNVILYFGNGGTDWASNTATYAIIALNMTDKRTDESDIALNGAGKLVWKIDLAPGEKVWSAVTVIGDSIYVSTSFGTMESSDPNSDVDSTGADGQQGFVRGFKRQSGVETSSNALTEKARGAVFVHKGELFSSSMSGTVTKVDLGLTPASKAIIRSWKEQFAE